MKETMENTLMKFEERDIKSKIQYDLKFFSRNKKSFEYVSKKLIELGFFLDISNLDVIDLENQIKWNEGKNYNWCVLKSDEYTFIIRHYSTHFTVFTKEKKTHKGKDYEYDINEYGAFMFSVNTDRLQEDEICEEAKKYEYPQDYYNCDNRFHDFNNMIKPIIQGFKDDYGRMLWNNSAIKRPKHVKLENVYVGKEIYSVDKLIFCGDELGSQHLFLYSENEMVEMVNEISKIKPLPKEIKSVHTDLDKNDPYYHGVGIYFEKDSHMQDVYSLTRWYHDKVLKIIGK